MTRYSAIIRTKDEVFMTEPIDTLSSVNDRMRKLLRQLLKEGKITQAEYDEKGKALQTLIEDAKVIKEEQRLKQQVVFIDKWQKMKEKGGFF